MSKILLVIKAETFHQAKSALRKHKIYAADSSIYTVNSKEFRARTDAGNILAVQRWYQEREPIIPDYGYPIGSLLFFRPEV